MITIKEMADIIGVSPTTVSNVIRGKTKEVSPQMVEKVNKILKEYNYVPNMSAISLAKSNSSIVALVLNSREINYGHEMVDYFTVDVIGELERRMHEKEYYLMLYISDDIDEIISFSASWNIDGIIALGFNYEEARRLRDIPKKPLVFIDGYFNQDKKGYNNIGLEDYKGAYDMTKYLIENGHKKLLYLTFSTTGVDGERIRGFNQAIIDSGLDQSAGSQIVSSLSKKGLEECLATIGDKITNYSAIFCSTDSSASITMSYLIQQGYRIPEDISIVGYDDAPIAALLSPRLTSVHQSPNEKAKAAAQKLLKIIKNPKEKSEELILPVSLKIRESVKNLNKK